MADHDVTGRSTPLGAAGGTERLAESTKALQAATARLAAQRERGEDVLAHYVANRERRRRGRARTYALLSEATRMLTEQTAQLDRIVAELDGLAERVGNSPQLPAAIADVVRRAL